MMLPARSVWCAWQRSQAACHGVVCMPHVWSLQASGRASGMAATPKVFPHQGVAWLKLPELLPDGCSLQPQ